jgi:hypothetical protein
VCVHNVVATTSHSQNNKQTRLQKFVSFFPPSKEGAGGLGGDGGLGATARMCPVSPRQCVELTLLPLRILCTLDRAQRSRAPS